MYRVLSTGAVIECDSAEDVAALLAVFALAVPEPEARSVKPKRLAATDYAPVLPPTGDSAEAAERRASLRSIISRSAVGLTMGELRKQTPKMDGKDRSNALQSLKARGEIRRTGNAWAVA